MLVGKFERIFVNSCRDIDVHGGCTSLRMKLAILHSIDGRYFQAAHGYMCVVFLRPE